MYPKYGFISGDLRMIVQADVKSIYRSVAEQRSLPHAPMIMPDQQLERDSAQSLAYRMASVLRLGTRRLVRP